MQHSTYILGNEKEKNAFGTLLSNTNTEMVLQNDDETINVLKVSPYKFDLPQLPEGLITKPTLHWIVETNEPKKHELEMSYLTSGMTWAADYVMVYNDSNAVMDLNGWVTINNNAGTTFKNAKIKLIAGEVNRVGQPRRGYSTVIATGGTASYVTEEPLFEYHLYDIKQQTTLKDSEQKQVGFLESNDVQAKKELITTNGGKVAVYIKFNNTVLNNMGIPLPAGKIKSFIKDSSGKLQFIGENSIDHTPKGEEISIHVGNAFDILVSKKRTKCVTLDSYGKPAFYLNSSRVDQEYEIEVRNRKDKPINISIVEGIRTDDVLLDENHEHEQLDLNTLKWRLSVPTDSIEKLIYSTTRAKEPTEQC